MKRFTAISFVFASVACRLTSMWFPTKAMAKNMRKPQPIII
ncbi:hypothetical protein [Vibrio taketomensis]|nr:hypothetical protein [Vibrio taketomensis]